MRYQLPEKDMRAYRNATIWKLRRTGHSIREIAEKLGISESTVKRTLRKTK
ncbi:helix-turn-helix domain-containing protein [uncultured Lactobacillus sp.]|uniref:helix-turn-helix domain-containing protein n=1 Tax=uncultured Lactobacillus sp. TaxID=153152 RepID=UPI003458BDFC